MHRRSCSGLQRLLLPSLLLLLLLLGTFVPIARGVFSLLSLSPFRALHAIGICSCTKSHFRASRGRPFTWPLAKASPPEETRRGWVRALPDRKVWEIGIRIRERAVKGDRRTPPNSVRGELSRSPWQCLRAVRPFPCRRGYKSEIETGDTIGLARFYRTDAGSNEPRFISTRSLASTTLRHVRRQFEIVASDGDFDRYDAESRR